jgi:tRNA A37 methylthiotransferase MiaB
VPLEVKKARLHAVETLQEGIARELNAAYVGREELVLVEEHQVQDDRHLWKGRTRTNKLVFFPAARPARSGTAAERPHPAMAGERVGSASRAAVSAPEVGIGIIAPVRIERATAWSLQGVLATAV